MYYPTWAMMPSGSSPLALPPAEIDWEGITHVVHFFNNCNVDAGTQPYFTIVTNEKHAIDYQYNGIANPMSGPKSWTDWQKVLIGTAHAHGVKVCLNVNAVDAKALNAVAEDQTRTDTFADALVRYAEERGYDGVEVNWEGWITRITSRENVSRLIRGLRARLDRSPTVDLLLLSPPSTDLDRYDPAVTNDCVDQINMQLYWMAMAWHPGIQSNGAWFINPLDMGTGIPGGFEGKSFDTVGPSQWAAAGHDPQRLAAGIPAFGWVFKGTDRLFGRHEPGPGYAKYQDALRLLANGGAQVWDDERKAHYIHGTALRTEGNQWWGQPGVREGQKFFVTYQTPRAVEEEVAWALGSGFGGIMMYDLTMDLDNSKPPGQRNPLHRAVRDAMRRRVPVTSVQSMPSIIPR